MAFTPQNFKDQIGGPIASAWLNPLDVTVNSVLAGAQTVAAAQAALGISPAGLANPVAVVNGGTGSTTGVLDSSLAPTSQIYAVDQTFNRTPAEISAGVTPTNYGYPPGYVERYGGSPSASAATNNTALTNAFAVLTAAGGGALYFATIGTYKFSQQFIVPGYVIIQGQGYGTVLSWSTSTGGFWMQNGRTIIQNMWLAGPGVNGTGNAGVGILVGGDNGAGTYYNPGLVTLENVLVGTPSGGWATGLQVKGCAWLRVTNCEFGNPAGGSVGSPQITNNTGVDFTFATSNNSINAVLFEHCTVSNNANYGVTSSAGLTINCYNWAFRDCTVQNNCVSNAASGWQFYVANVIGFVSSDFYAEYVLGGTVPECVRMDLLAKFDWSNWTINGASYGFHDHGGNSCNQGAIHHGSMLVAPVTATIYMASEVDILAYGLDVSPGPITLTGVGCTYLPTASGICSWPTNESTIPGNPVLNFVGGSITQTTVTKSYSQIGNVTTIALKITWSATSSPTGSVTINNLPAPKYDSVVPLYYSGITVATGDLVLEIGAGTTTGTIYNVQTTTAQLLGTALAASGSLVVSGSYQV